MRTDLLERCCRPKAHISIQTAAGEQASIPRERQTVNGFQFSCENKGNVPRGEVPKPNSSILGCRGQGRAIGSKGYRLYFAGMGFEGSRNTPSYDVIEDHIL